MGGKKNTEMPKLLVPIKEIHGRQWIPAVKLTLPQSTASLLYSLNFYVQLKQNIPGRISNCTQLTAIARRICHMASVGWGWGRGRFCSESLEWSEHLDHSHRALRPPGLEARPSYSYGGWPCGLILTPGERQANRGDQEPRVDRASLGLPDSF